MLFVLELLNIYILKTSKKKS